jgi:hypothetical protein
MKAKILTAVGVATLLALFSFTSAKEVNQKQKYGTYVNDDGDTVYEVAENELFVVDGINLTSPVAEKYVLCPGSGCPCIGEIRTTGGIVISYNSSKGVGRLNIEKE